MPPIARDRSSNTLLNRSSHHSVDVLGRSSHHSVALLEDVSEHNNYAPTKAPLRSKRQRNSNNSNSRATLGPLCLALAIALIFLNVNKFSQTETIQFVATQQQSKQQFVKQKTETSFPPPSPPTSLDIQTTSPYAYMFVLGGINPDTPGYRGFLYNVMVTADILRKQGSTADFVLYLQLHPEATNHTRLPEVEEAALQQLNIHTLYLDKPQASSFSDIVMEKFRALQLTQYKRVLFLDADVLPFTNMDYLMELSDPESARMKASNSTALIKPNFIMATKGEPCNAGVFMVEPKPGDYDKLLEIVRQQHEAGQKLPYPHFSKEHGWGHSFRQAGDEWQSVEQSGKRWIWHAVHSDQGLLYQWVRYHEKSYTAFRGTTVDNFVLNDNVSPQLEASFSSSMIEAHEPPTKIVEHHPCGKTDYNCRNAPYSNFRHFVGKSKPWQYGYRGEQDLKRRDRYHVRAYFEGLFDLSERFGLGITRDNVNERLQGESPLGQMAFHQDVVNTVRQKESK